eukprot:g18063.t1
MDALPKQKRKLWRGLSVDLHKNSQYKVGNTVVWWGISSCTSDEKVAKGFAEGCGGKSTLITVESKTASDISQVTFYSNEKESLLSPGTQLKVKSNKMNGNVCEITLEEVVERLRTRSELHRKPVKSSDDKESSRLRPDRVRPEHGEADESRAAGEARSEECTWADAGAGARLVDVRTKKGVEELEERSKVRAEKAGEAGTLSRAFSHDEKDAGSPSSFRPGAAKETGRPGRAGECGAKQRERIVVEEEVVFTSPKVESPKNVRIDAKSDAPSEVPAHLRLPIGEPKSVKPALPKSVLVSSELECPKAEPCGRAQPVPHVESRSARVQHTRCFNHRCATKALDRAAPRGQSNAMVIGHVLTAGSLAFDTLEYNRDGFAAAAGMRQNQMYQEKSYHINLIAALRRSDTLLFGIAAGFLCEGEINESAADFMVHAYYTSMVVSVLYFGLSMVFAVLGVTLAYSESRQFLLNVVPDPLDKYDFDYMSQLKEFERDSQAYRVPVLSSLVMSMQTKKKSKEGRVPMEELPRGASKQRASGRASTARAALEQKAEETIGRPPEPRSYFEVLGEYNSLWEPCSTASHECMAHGIFGLCQGFAMFVLGHNYDRSHWGSAPLLHVCQCVERLANRGSDERRLVVFVFVCALV